MGACMSHKVEYPNEIHPNLFTVAIVGKAPSANKHSSTNGRLAVTSETAFFRWSFIKSACRNAGSSGGNSDDETIYQQGASTADSLYASFGQLEVTGSQLIYHRKGHQPVDWPLHFVRRYGYENNLFSFESGRRCRWQGVFTFRCRKAQQLFAAVQQRVQDPSATDDIHRISTNYSRPANIDRCLRLSLTDDPSYSAPLAANREGDNNRLLQNGTLDVGATNNNRLSDDSSSSIVYRRRLSSSRDVDYDDDESNSQVFVEITPANGVALKSSGNITNSLIVDIRRRSILDSCGSTKTLNSNTLPLSNDQVLRPRSVDQLAENFEKLSNANNNVRNAEPTQITISFDETDTPESMSVQRPSNPYYMNIDTSKPVRNPSLRGASSATCIHAPFFKQQKSNHRTRSISSDSKVQSQIRSLEDDLFGDYYAAPCRGLSASVTGGNYVNLPAAPADDPMHSSATATCCSLVNGEGSNIEYTLVDVSPCKSDRSSPGRRCSQPDSPFGVKGHSRKSSSNSGQFFNGNGLPNGANASTGDSNIRGVYGGSSATLSPVATTNYAQIDCTKTKALRQTAAQHRQMGNGQQCVVSGTMKYRTKSAQMDCAASDARKNTTNSCSDGVPVKRNKKDCKLRL